MDLAADIEDAFASTGRTITPRSLQRLVGGLSGEHADFGARLDHAIAQSAEDGAVAPLADLLALREARRERADPRRLIARLEIEADCLDQRAEIQAEQAAEFFGKAAWRQSRGDQAIAADFDAGAHAAEAVAVALQAEAFDRRLKAAVLRSRLRGEQGAA